MKKEVSNLVLSLSFISDDALWQFAEAIGRIGEELGIVGGINVMKKETMDQSSRLINEEENRKVIFNNEAIINKMNKIAKIRREIIASTKKEVEILDNGGRMNQ